MKTNQQPFIPRIIKSITLIMLVFAFTQCRGPRGFDGYNGEDGQDGTITYSTIYDVASNRWEGDFDGYNAWLEVPEINDDIYYNGAVLVYRLIEVEPKSFNLLPYTYVDGGFTIYMDCDIYVGGIDLLYKEITDGINDTYAPNSLMSFKVVIIEGIPLATLKGMVDVKDYPAVSKFLQLDAGNQGGYQKIY